MTWSIPIGSVAGTAIRIHVTFLLLLLWITITYYIQGGTQAAIQGVTFVVLVFVCIVLHEFGHVLAAKRYGVQTPDITLLPIGGVARLSRIPEHPGQELVIALAGPAVNVIIAAFLYFVLGTLPTLAGTDLQSPGSDMLERLASVNVFLVLFNLIPAFPMDGGRVLRALLAYRMSYIRATQLAASIGQGVAFLFGLLGLFGNPLLLFIALFVYLAAAAEAHSVQMRQVSRGILAADAAITRFEALSPASRLADAVQALIRTTQHEFPVVDGAGRLRGVLTRDAMIKALAEYGPNVPVTEVMTRDVPVVQSRQSLEDAIQLLQDNGAPVAAVVDPTGRLVGLITPENIGEVIMVQSARPQHPAAATPQRRPIASPWMP
ncbi:MAG TPA: site-2 protease family protein [Acetobacteraceae bacterium]|jgi:stage IV sporulation protein FB|nr:site-2 protease family protein [Acetobacteraceae bacterium]